MSGPRIQRLAQVLVDYSIDVQPSQRVAITGQTPTASLIQAVYERVLQHKSCLTRRSTVVIARRLA
jgi:leucyl aminopeptidase (aminopeptidase T)